MKKILHSTIIFTFLQLFFISTKAQTYTITTIAGNGTQGFSGDGGAATAAELDLPFGVAVDAAANIYIADTYNYRIRKVNTSAIISTIAGSGYGASNGDGGAATSAGFGTPYGVAVDGAGNVYIVDSQNSVIRKVNTSGIISTIAGSSQGYSGDGGAATYAELNYPYGVAVDAAGNVYIADGGNNRIRKVNTSGIISTIAGNGTNGFSGDGGAATSAELNYPEGVAVDASGNVYIADFNNYRIRKVSTSGIITTIAGDSTFGFSGDGGAAISAELSQPEGVAVDVAGNVYIADGGNNRIRKVNTSGIITTIAGDSIQGFSGDGGAATSAELNQPDGVAVDAAGNVYATVFGNNRIRKLTVATGVSENNFSNASINVFPNPSNGIFNFVQENNFQKSSLEIYNVLGEKIISTMLNSAQTQINLSGKAKGIYFYKVVSADGKNISEGKLELIEN